MKHKLLLKQYCFAYIIPIIFRKGLNAFSVRSEMGRTTLRVLIDTNIFIYREDLNVVPSNLQELFRILADLSVKVCIHPLSIDEIQKDSNEERKKVILSKISTYPVYSDYVDPKQDGAFNTAIGEPKNNHDVIDNILLYSVYRDAFDFLLTEDRDIHRKARFVGVSDRVLDIDEAAEYFRRLILDERLPLPVSIEYIPVSNLNLDDPFFDSLKNEYAGFDKWWSKISREGRRAWIYRKDNHLGAVLILKIEDEALSSSPPLPKCKRLKICTFKVSDTGKKIGELFIKISIEYAAKNNIDELYLTHFTGENDYLIYLIENFGFQKEAEINGEDIFCKRMVVNEPLSDPLLISNRFYPSFYDGSRVKKFIVPIRPEYHKKLFIVFEHTQLSLPGITDGMIIEQNTIKKAYLCHSKIKKIETGDILLFYRSQDVKSITTIGVVERVYPDSSDADEIIRNVGKRSVYTRSEIEEMANTSTKTIIFKYHFLITHISLDALKDNCILQGAPQSIVGISHDKYLKLKQLGELDERFTVN